MGNVNVPSEWPKDFSDLYNHPKFIRYQQEMLLKGLAERTVLDYGRALKQFLMSFDVDVESLNNDDIKTYLIELQELGFSDSKIKISLSLQLRLIFELIFNLLNNISPHPIAAGSPNSAHLIAI